MADVLSRFIADPAVSTVITAVVAGVIALWLLSAMWVHGDAERRTGSQVAGLAAAGWVLVSSPLLLPLSLAAYAFVRPAEPVGERRVRELTAAYVADSLVAASCGGCGGVVDESWLRCPACATWLATPCAGCGRWSDVDLETCPWCGEVERDRPTGAGPAFVSVAAPRLEPAGAGRRLAGSDGPHRLRADRRPALVGGERRAVATEDRGRRRRGLRSRVWNRRAPVAADARTIEHGTSGGPSGGRSRA